MRLVFTIVVLLFFAGNIPAQTGGGKVITDRKLTWADFSGEPDKQSVYDAMTYWFVKNSYRCNWTGQSDTVSVVFTVQPLFQEQSWVKKNRKSDELLRHEQGHYDLAIICAEMVKENFAKGIYLKQNYATTIDSVFQSTLVLVKRIEDQYDADTNHMMNKEEQERWNGNIAALLGKVPDIYRVR